MKLKPSRAYIAFAHDVVMAASSFVSALYLRLGDGLWLLWSNGDLLLGTVLFVVVAIPVFLSLRLYRGVWRYASTSDMAGLVRATTLTILIFTVVLFLVNRLQTVPRSVLIINWFVLVTLLGGPRFLYRSFKDRRQALRAFNAEAVPALLVGAGDEAELFIRATRSVDAEYRAVGLVSERGARVGRNIHGIDVLGSIDELDAVVEQLKRRGQAPQRLIITDPRLDGAIVRELFDAADRLGMILGRIPRLTELKDGLGDEIPIRPIAVEDLLGRPQQALDRSGLEEMIRGRRVMVTGAGGSIGSELVRQIAAFAPERLVLFEACEFNLYSIDQELCARPDAPQVVPLLGDVRDAGRVRQAMADHRPDLVFHAAALKHVPMVEHNPDEGILTNAIGTRIVADACIESGTALMVQISTDKAVNPTNVMGASKRVAEMYAQALDLAVGQRPGGTRFVTVRFGNVLGSTGSVVPLFQRQLAAGGPITVTHPEMTRYFMTVREAVELVLHASQFGACHADYRGKIFVLDMGEPVRIVDLARQMIRLAGLRPDHDIAITFTGLRPGEKLFEEIFHGAEPPVATGQPGLLVATPRAVDVESLGLAIDDLGRACLARQSDDALAILRRLVPEYKSSGEHPLCPPIESVGSVRGEGP
ncbi:polysaccharide biosynthesis protein [Magnetospirillum molischianum]|uniref:Predicted nucleoside-diphosphate sugar epimerase n=1 Tax=Magnetospirillum molischianum DSM 120 TaxID=1150626 RepID=H8FTL5_MAGML|nr:nucleoside-diphosphate sugar epimerase/dehydratase [Magnetospirillum molischianum]CCG41703.1 Predicted nucleoside-diphosphate sugar epimerase [Magnetospirillum molischianum DSM 120]